MRTEACSGHATATSEVPPKALYLRGGKGLTVTLDGRALRVRRLERAAIFYPLTRLARILSQGQVEWSYAALLACAGAGIPVVFLDGNGGARAYLFGASSGQGGLYRRLRAEVWRAEGPNRYRDWRRTMTACARRALQQRLRQCGVLSDPVLAWRGFTPLTHSAAIHCSETVAPQSLHGVLTGLSAQLWLEAGLNAARLAHLERLPLVDDLADLLAWALAEPILLERRNNTESTVDDAALRHMVMLVEARREEILQFGRTLLMRLRLCLGG